MRSLFEDAPGLACKIVNMGDESFHDVAETRLVWCLIDPLDILSDVLTSQVHHGLLLPVLIHDANNFINSDLSKVHIMMMIPSSIVVMICSANPTFYVQILSRHEATQGCSLKSSRNSFGYVRDHYLGTTDRSYMIRWGKRSGNQALRLLAPA